MRLVRSFDCYVNKNPFSGFIETVPAFVTVTLFYDVLITEAAGVDVLHFVQSALNDYGLDSDAGDGGRLIEIPVCYNAEYGPDLETLATDKNMDKEELIGLHTGIDYHVHMMGFLPGFAYMASVDESLVSPRRASPRARVEAGSVGVAGRQTGIYPLDSPGGWQIIGRTPLPVYRPCSESPFLLSSGDRVRFYPISEEQFVKIKNNQNIPEDLKQPPSGIKVATVLKPGLFSVFQDEGRFGYRNKGVPAGGPADEVAYHLANSMLGNKRNSATLEITMGNFSIELSHDITVCITGCGAARLDGAEVPLGQRVEALKGQLLEINYTGQGWRSYLAVKGGFDAPLVLGSRCALPAIGIGGLISKGQSLYVSENTSGIPNKVSVIPGVDSLPDVVPIRFYPGREYFKLSDLDREKLEQNSFCISNRSNRMGIYLEGGSLADSDMEEMVSTAVTPGVVQLTPNGQLIVLMHDCQTTGGYPRVMQVIKSDLTVLARKKTGSVIQFKKITFDEAKKIEIERQRLFAGWYRLEL